MFISRAGAELLRRLRSAGGGSFDGGLVQNGGFDSGAHWALTGSGSAVSISGGQLHFDDSAEEGPDARQSIGFVNGTSYSVTYTITSVAGFAGVSVRLGGTALAGTVRNAAGTYTETLTADVNSTDLRFVLSPFTRCSIDNVRAVAV